MALLDKDVRLSLPWFLTNLTLLLVFLGLSVFFAYRHEEMAFLFLVLSMAGLSIWAIFAGIATYFSEREGRIYEFINTVPINRTFVLLSKLVWLVLQATLYFTVLSVGAFVVFRIYGGLNVPEVQEVIGSADLIKLVLSGYFRLLLTLTSGLVAASLVKDLPFKWLWALLLLMVIVWAVGWVDLGPVFGVDVPKVMSPGDLSKVQTVRFLNELVRFLISLLFLILGGIWIERRGY